MTPDPDDVTLGILFDRGPRNRLHTGWTKDCYYGRPEGCCSLCFLRLLTAPLRLSIGGDA